MLRLLNYCVKLLEPLSAQQPLLMRCIILYRRHRHPQKIPRTLDPISPIWLSSTGKTPPRKTRINWQQSNNRYKKLEI